MLNWKGVDMAKITFVLGGARSGKSAFAEGLAQKYHDVVYIATAEVKDAEMRDRIQVHRARRPFHWKTLEAPFQVDRVISNLNVKAELVYIDCITLYITNMLLRDETDACRDERTSTPAKDDKNTILNKTASSADSFDIQGENIKRNQPQILDKINKLCRACRESASDVIIVSNEVGLGIVPDNALSRVFRDIAGSANQMIAHEADEVYFMVAGIAQRIK